MTDVPLRRGGSGTLTPPEASEVDNDSSVPGDTVKDALEYLAGTPVPVNTDQVANVSGVTGATCSDALDNLETDINAVAALVAGLDSSDVANASLVTGVTVTNALNNLAGSFATLNSSQVANSSSVSGATVTLALNALLALANAGIKRVAQQTFVADGTYTPTPGMAYCLAIGTGAGGGGGAADTDGNNNSVAVGGGGAAGATAWGLFSAATIGANQSVGVGTAGIGGAAAGGGNGTAGSKATTLGALLSADPGGAGNGSGVSAAAESTAAAVTGPNATGGFLNQQGGSGEGGYAQCSVTGVTCIAISGAGGRSFWGPGGLSRRRGQLSVSADLTQAGSNAPTACYGAGGGGAVCFTTASGVAGGDAQGGYLFILEFCTQ